MNRGPGIGVLTTDVALTVRSCTAWLARLTGATPAAACGRLLTDVAPVLARDEARGALGAALRHGTTSTLALAWPLPAAAHADNGDGHAVPLHARVGPLRSEGQITGVILTVSAADTEAADARPLDGFRGAHWLARRETVRSLRAARDAALVAEVLELLREEHRDLDVAASAVTLLEATDVDVVDPLVDLLSEADADLRVQAALLLGHRSSARAVRALLAVLDDADANVRFQAIESLGRLQAPEAVERLTAIAEAGFLPRLSRAVRAGAHRRSAPGTAARPAPRRADAERGGGGSAG
jgi:HEAT repeat protein